jgi:hypothetical protein
MGPLALLPLQKGGMLQICISLKNAGHCEN